MARRYFFGSQVRDPERRVRGKKRRRRFLAQQGEKRASQHSQILGWQIITDTPEELLNGRRWRLLHRNIFL